MRHLVILPVLLPALTAVILLLARRASLRTRRWLGGVSVAALLLLAVALLSSTLDGTVHVYELGSWPAPFGIVLVLDRLSALMVLLTAVLALFSHLYAIYGPDALGTNYHSLFHFQLMGLCGAFLTGDLFNLFVFFEILLIASYGLLLHGGARSRLRAGLHYVVFNLVGSALFLVGVGTLYGVTGTLNLADLSVKVAQVGAGEVALVKAGALVLLVVFGVKAAILPLYFWLPSAYASATAPVAALFAIMTKVGVYSILRVFTLVFGADAGPVAHLAEPWLLPLALATLLAGTLGAMAARGLGGLVAYLVVASVGTMLTAVALGSVASITAAVYYMIHSTVVLAGLFLLVDLIARQRGPVEGDLEISGAVGQPAVLGGLFLVGGVAVVGLPPLSGFVGKALVLESALAAPAAAWVYGVVLFTGLLTLVAFSRAGSLVFWNVREPEVEPPVAGGGELLPAASLLGLAVVLALLAGPVVDFAAGVARQLVDPDDYVEAVLESDAARAAREAPMEPEGAH